MIEWRKLLNQKYNFEKLKYVEFRLKGAIKRRLYNCSLLGAYRISKGFPNVKGKQMHFSPVSIVVKMILHEKALDVDPSKCGYHSRQAFERSTGNVEPT